MNRALLVVLAVVAGCATGPLVAQDVPVGPDRPASSDDCMRAFAPAFGAHYRKHWCRHCVDLDGFPSQGWSRRYTACHRHCGAERQSQHDALMAARAACFARVPERQQQLAASRREGLAEGMKLAERIYDASIAASAAADLLHSPARFFDQASAALSAETAGWLMARRAREPETVEAQLHHYAVTQARAGIAAASSLRARSDLIAQIQSTALDRIVDVHSDVLRQFDDAMRQVDGLLAESRTRAGSPPSMPLRPSPPSTRSERMGEPPCAILGTKASEDLAIDQPDVYERLVARCRR